MESKGRISNNAHLNKESIVIVTVHYCELKSEKLLVHPVVCLHVINSNHGSYVKKQDRERAVTSFYENQRGDIDYIMPIMTQPCTVQGKKSQVLSWEESFILNENLEHLLKNETSTILFFEIIDLVPLSFTKYHYERLNENGMQKLAWAFLKVLGSNNVVNTGNKLRLQLYKPHISRKKKTSPTEVYRWWSKKPRVPLPASLYISFEQHDAYSIEPALRSMLPLQEEVGTSSNGKTTGANKESAILSQDNAQSATENKNDDVKWFRKEGEPFRVPTKHSLTLECANSCQILKFSSMGRMLVAGCGALGQHSLYFYEIPSGKLMHKMLAHSDVIYDLDCSEDDEHLLSASADYCVKLWSVKSWSFISAFIHPSFVYSAKFQPALKHIVVTACYDHVIRIWTFNKSVQLLQELEGHNASVNTLCWHKRSMKLFSADSIGEIKIWKFPHRQKNANKGFDNYEFDKDLSFSEMKGISVDRIINNAGEDVLFLFCGDAIVRIFDLSVGRLFVCHEAFSKSENTITGCCSPCGNLLFLCNNDGSVLVWSRESSGIMANLPNTFHHCQLTSVDYHPLDHILALSTSEDGGPIHLYTYDKLDQVCENREPDVLEKHPKAVGSRDVSIGTPLKNKEILKSLHNVHEKSRQPSKRNSSKSYMYNAETSSDEGFAKLSLNTFSNKGYSSESVGSVKCEKSKNYLEESGNTESFTAIVTKSGQFDIITVADSTTESDNHGSGCQSSKTGHPDVLQRSSKRSQRRKKLREMSKPT